MADLDVIRTQLKFDWTFTSFVNFIIIACVCVYIVTYYIVWHGSELSMNKMLTMILSIFYFIFLQWYKREARSKETSTWFIYG